MTELEKLQAELKTADDELKSAQRKRGAVLDRLAALCPVRIGDVVECNGYTHAGKKIVVEYVLYNTSSWSRGVWVCSGAVLKKCGSPSRFRGEHRV